MLLWPVIGPIYYVVAVACERDESERKDGLKDWLAINAFECWFEALPQVC